MEWWKTWEVDGVACWTAMREVNDKAVLRVWVCGQCSEIDGDSRDRERVREFREGKRREEKQMGEK